MTRITAELMQMNLSGATVMLVAGVALLMIVMIILLLVRSGAGRREREARMRARLIEMEREAQFTAAADRVPQSRHAVDVATHISSLFREHLSIPVLAVYARHECDAQFINVLAQDQSSSALDLPAAIPATLWPANGQVSVESLASITGSASTGNTIGEQPAVAVESENPNDENLEPERITARLEPLEPELNVASGAEAVLLIPWNSMYQWNGLIVASLPAGTAATEIEPHRDAIARLTERLAVALEFESVDFSLDASEQRAERTTRFSQSLISCLEEPSPL